jgi:hypothetical protein
MLPDGPIVMFPPPALVFTVAETEGAGVGAAVAVAAAEDPAAAEAADDAAVDPADVEDDAGAEDGAGAVEDREGSAWDAPGADEDWVDEQPTTATAAKTAQTAATLTLL